jgi:hypothetical protein
MRKQSAQSLLLTRGLDPMSWDYRADPEYVRIELEALHDECSKWMTRAVELQREVVRLGGEPERHEIREQFEQELQETRERIR